MNSTDPQLSWLPSISPASPGALYEQIVEGLKREISQGRLAAGTPLPSFRKLAEDLMVSVITVKRAYEELERAGIIYRRQGLGTFVSPNGHDRTREVKLERARQLVTEAFQEASQAGLSTAGFLELIQTTLAQNKKQNS